MFYRTWAGGAIHLNKWIDQTSPTMWANILHQRRIESGSMVWAVLIITYIISRYLTGNRCIEHIIFHLHTLNNTDLETGALSSIQNEIVLRLPLSMRTTLNSCFSALLQHHVNIKKCSWNRWGSQGESDYNNVALELDAQTTAREKRRKKTNKLQTI